MVNEAKLMRQIMEYDFAQYELMLYLDTHPEDAKALKLYRKVTQKANELRELYEANFGPITADASMEEERWNWIDNPWPWDK